MYFAQNICNMRSFRAKRRYLQLSLWLQKFSAVSFCNCMVQKSAGYTFPGTIAFRKRWPFLRRRWLLAKRTMTPMRQRGGDCNCNSGFILLYRGENWSWEAKISSRFNLNWEGLYSSPVVGRTESIFAKRRFFSSGDNDPEEVDLKVSHVWRFRALAGLREAGGLPRTVHTPPPW